MVAKTGS